MLNILNVLYVDRICTEYNFVENRIKKFHPFKSYSDVGLKKKTYRNKLGPVGRNFLFLFFVLVLFVRKR